MRKSVPSQTLCDQLAEIVDARRLFLERECLEQSGKTIQYHSSISYESDCKAIVRFHWGTGEVIACYEINKLKPDAKWHCYRDWND